MQELHRRRFLQLSAAGCAACLASRRLARAFLPGHQGIKLVSPGCRGTRVKVARLFLGQPRAHWPTPTMDLEPEMRRYEDALKSNPELADVEFAPGALVTRPEQVAELAPEIAAADGVLAIHLSMGVMGIVRPLLALGKPTVLFAAPYSGHEWTLFGGLMKQPEGANLECILSSGMDDLAAAVRPFRAIHHLREAKILNISDRKPAADYLEAVGKRFGTAIMTIGREPVLAAYEAVDPAAAEAEAARWIAEAEAVVEPPRDEVVRSCRLALAFERLVDEEGATVLTADCYGSMYRRLPAFPCVGFVRLNDSGLGGICESDLRCAMTHILAQGLSGRPGFISDPTVDEGQKAIILAHCLGTRRMDGPAGEPAPYKLRSIMERQEGCVPQVRMRAGQKVTQLILLGADRIRWFTGTIAAAPESERGCRTKIAVAVDGDLGRLWRNWEAGLHRVTVYGDLMPDLRRFCRFKGVELVDEMA